MNILSLKNQAQFEQVNKHGSKIHDAHFILVMYKNISDELSFSNPITLGMKVSRKFSKKAIVRNKAKRRIRHLIQLLVKSPNIATDNKSIIVIPKRDFENCDFSKLSHNFFRAFVKLSENL